MFLRNAWYIGAFSEEIADKPLARTLLNEPVVFFRDANGKVAALEDRCCHRAAPLSLGEVVPTGLQCGYHGLVFNGNGACVHIPGQDRIPPGARVTTYPTIERDGHVWIWMGDPAKVTEESLIKFPHGDEDTTGWPLTHVMMHVDGAYDLMIENLMDLTHLPFVHRTSIGANAEEHANAEMKTERTPRGVRFMRWLLNAAPPPRYITRFGFKGRIDRWEEFEFVAPSIVLQYTGAIDAGTGAYDKGKRDGGHRSRLMHGLTPETDKSCHYFWINVDGGNPLPGQKVSSIKDGAIRLLQEDAEMIAAQQRRLDGYDMKQLIDIKSDMARAQMTRILDEMIAEEQRATRQAAE